MVTTRGPAKNPTGRSGVRGTRRPKDRKAQVTRAAAETFNAQGYPATSMQDIAAKVGISAAALYRHYPGKYELFVVVVEGIVEALVDSTAFVDEVSADEVRSDAPAIFDRMLDALITAAIRTSSVGGLYLANARYLRPADRDRLTGRLAVVTARVQRCLAALRPQLNAVELRSLSMSVLSVTAAASHTRTTFPDDMVRPVLREAARSVVAAQLPAADDLETDSSSVWRVFSPGAGPYESLLNAASLLFGRQGYAETTVTEIAVAVGMPASGFYRYFSSKSEVLVTALQHAVDRIAGELSAIVGVFADPREALSRLAHAYVATVFCNPEVAACYDTEWVNLTPTQRALLRDSERSIIELWSGPLSAIRPDLDDLRTKLVVRVLAVLVEDHARVWRARAPGDCASTAYPQARLRAVMQAIMQGRELPA